MLCDPLRVTVADTLTVWDAVTGGATKVSYGFEICTGDGFCGVNLCEVVAEEVEGKSEVGGTRLSGDLGKFESGWTSGSSFCSCCSNSSARSFALT